MVEQNERMEMLVGIQLGCDTDAVGGVGFEKVERQGGTVNGMYTRTERSVKRQGQMDW